MALSGPARVRGFGILLALLAFASVAIAGGLSWGPSSEDAAAQSAPPLPEGPNVVIIQTDDQRLDELRVMRATRRLLGRGGVEFRNYFASYPLCCPSRSTLLTGQYSHNHGVVSNKGPSGGYQALDHTRTLPMWLQEAGYHTAHIGKYMNEYHAGRLAQPVPPGWDEWYTESGGGHRMYGYELFEQGPEGPARMVSYGSAPADYKTDVLADKAVDYVHRRAPYEPFFLQLDPTAPHVERRSRDAARNPRPAPRHQGRFDDARVARTPSFNERDISDKPPSAQRDRLTAKQRRRIDKRYRSRLESLLAVDDAVGRVVRALRETNELSNTVIVFASDNGFMLGEHRVLSGKKKLYEEAVHVPLLVRGPGFPAGREVRQLTANVDLAPTILDLAGATASGRTIDGRSLLPIVSNPRQGRDRNILLENGPGGSTGIRTRRFAYFEHARRERELYDIRSDPLQLESLHRRRAFRDTRRGLAQELDRLRDCSGASCGAALR